MKKNTNSPMKEKPKAKRAKAQRSVQQDTKEVLAELVEMSERKAGAEADCGEPSSSGSARRAESQSGPADGGSGFGRPTEQLLHFGFARGEVKSPDAVCRLVINRLSDNHPRAKKADRQRKLVTSPEQHLSHPGHRKLFYHMNVVGFGWTNAACLELPHGPAPANG